MEKKYRLIKLNKTESTNEYAHSLHTEAEDTTPLVISADQQTAGRGQRGNTWESEPDKNLTFSLVLHPRFIAPSHQFELSMLVSIGIMNALRGMVDNPKRIKIKWPNDIYFGNFKIAGILIENSLTTGAIDRSVIGIGLNVNQTRFTSEAPNPISLIHTTGVAFDRDEVLDKIVNSIIEMVEQYEVNSEPDELSYLYNMSLWRKDGLLYNWELPYGTVFEAMLDSVNLDGLLNLRRANGVIVSYRFKEVAHVL